MESFDESLKHLLHREPEDFIRLGLKGAPVHEVRLFRRERLPVLSHVWDLYGQYDEPVLQERTLHFGASLGQPHSVCVYHRVNLRGLGWEELLGLGLPGLWPLVARGELGATGRADHLAVLSFVAEAEGEARGEARGEKRGMKRGMTQAKKETIIRILTSRLGELEPAVRERIQALDSAGTLTLWYDEALQVLNARAARKLVEKMTKTSLM